MKFLLKKKALIYFLFLIFYFFQPFAYSDTPINYSKMNKYETKTNNLGYNYYYLDLSDFQDDDYLYFIISLKNGYFEMENMFFGIFSQIPNTPSLSKKVNPCSENFGSIYDEKYYDYYTYYYAIQKPKDNYIIVSPPGSLTSEERTKIQNSGPSCIGIIKEYNYLDGNTGDYKKCYDTCKKCTGPGTPTDNNCDKCANGYGFLAETFINTKNCFKNCNYYYYFNENNEYFCTVSDSCDYNYKLIRPKKKCINECKNDNENKYIS
jgi:hypothetical protein